MLLNELIDIFTLNRNDLLVEAKAFEKSIVDAMYKKSSSLLAMPAYIGRPSIQESGTYLSLDIGGSNIRIALIDILKGKIKQKRYAQKKIESIVGNKNLDVEDFFHEIALFIDSFAKEEELFLGHTFSYPMIQTSYNNAKLKKWTKELSFSGNYDFDINKMLSKQLLKLNRSDLKPIVILNDTVAVFLAASYINKQENVIGSIWGTGHNSCYYEEEKGTVINLESGNFTPLHQNKIDKILDKRTDCPGEQILEKMTGGNYLYQIINIAVELVGIKKQLTSSKDIGIILNRDDDSLKQIVKVILKRSAALLAAEYTGIYSYLVNKGIRLDKIAIDGSIYTNINFLQEELNQYLSILLKKPPQVREQHMSSLDGAAVAAAMIEKKHHK